MTRTFKALLFDLDGTLVDTAPMLREVMEAWSRKHGLSLEVVLAASHGVRTEDTIALVAPHLCAKTEAALIDQVESTSLSGLKPIRGADAFLRGITFQRWAVVTSSSLEAARLKLGAVGMAMPDVFVTAESVSKGKPDPEPYLVAARELGVAAEDCLVFEDADHGVNSAVAAGCKVVVVGDLCTVQHENIIAHAASFEELELTEEGNLRDRMRTICRIEKSQT